MGQCKAKLELKHRILYCILEHGHAGSHSIGPFDEHIEEITTLRSRIAELEQERDTALRKSIRLHQENERLERELGDIREEVVLRTETEERLRDANNELERELAEAKKDTARLHGKLTEMTSRCHAAESAAIDKAGGDDDEES